MDVMPPANLRPYGSAAVDSFAAAQGMTGAALQRAAYKYSVVLNGPISRAGANVPRTLVATLLAGIPAVLFLILGVSLALHRAEAAPGVAILLALGLVLGAIPVIMFVTSRPVSPKAALKEYFGALARGRYARARRIVIDPDLDAFPRVQPVIDRLGQPTGLSQPFQHDAAFKAYWDGLIRWRSPCYCLVAFRKWSVREIRPGVALAEVEVRFTMNTSLWALMFFVIGIFAIIIGLVTRTRIRVPLRKVLVRVNDEWRVFNGELMGADEHDLRWLDGHA